MAVFTSTILGRSIIGNKCLTWGTYNDANSAGGGDVDTGLHECEMVKLQVGGASVGTNAPAVNETLPVAGSAVTIVCDAAQTGYWMAVGDALN